jgi:hypothetical protein
VQAQIARPDRDACTTNLIPAAMGGPIPIDKNVLMRWLSTANYELAYHGPVYLLDAFYDRSPLIARLGSFHRK